MRVRSFLRTLAAAALAFAAVGTTSAQAAPESYDIDAVHSAVIFRIHHFGAGYSYGRFNEFSGKLVFDEANAAASSIAVEVKATSVDTANAKRDDHLRGPDFFDVAQFPTITFKSTAIKAAGATSYDVTGDLSMHGVTKSVTVRMEKTGAGKDAWGMFRVGFEGTMTVKRSDFGMKYGLDNGALGDEVRMTLSFEGARK